MAAVDPDDEPAMTEVRTKARTSHSAFHYEGRFRRADGGLRIIELYGRPRFDDSGAFRGHAGMATDVTEARASERHRNLLIGELNHRLKNTLATVQSLIRQTLREAEVSNEVADLVTGRLVALSEAHEVLNRELWDGADLLSIVEAVVKPYADGARITITGQTARVEAKNAVTVAMGLHELAVNSLKHGALSAPTGQVRLSWTQTGDSILLHWRESGGPRVTPPSHSGFGLRLLRGGLGAELAYEPDGLICGMRVAAQKDDNPLLARE